ncbi:MAG: hypothetical protein ACRD2H_05860 [Terriglobales bacterium]
MSYMPSNLWFDVGAAFAVPAGGNQAAAPTPIQLATLQNVSITLDRADKALYGAYDIAEDVASGHVKISGKAEFARIDLSVLANVYTGGSLTSGVVLSNTQSAVIPASTPFTITVTNSATFSKDLGVRFSDGRALTVVTTSPTTGEYSVAAGVYTFSTADASLPVSISYLSTSVTGRTLTVAKQFVGYSPVFELYLTNPYSGGGNGLHLFAAKAGKLAFDGKQEAYTLPNLDFTAFAPGDGNAYEFFETP